MTSEQYEVLAEEIRADNQVPPYTPNNVIVDSILKGTYDDDPSVRANQAINYWYGISAGPAV